ncbi:MAG TPA: hypothetical protein VF763_04665 [Candidatus Limnocylindrales bacterium]
MTHAPWEYLFLAFNSENFHDVFWPTVVVSIVLLVLLVALYAVRTRQLRHHAPYLGLYEWLLWTGVIVFGLLLTYAVFVFDFLFVLLTMLVGAAMFLWIRFVRFPPELAAYEQRLARQRYWSRARLSRPEATIRPRKKRRR